MGRPEDTTKNITEDRSANKGKTQEDAATSKLKIQAILYFTHACIVFPINLHTGYPYAKHELTHTLLLSLQECEYPE